MEETKKEWLIDRAKYMFAEIENEINHLQMQIEKDTVSVNKMEDDFRMLVKMTSMTFFSHGLFNP